MGKKGGPDPLDPPIRRHYLEEFPVYREKADDLLKAVLMYSDVFSMFICSFVLWPHMVD